MRELIIGGARSGKSALAERRASESGLQLIYLATGQALDAEMAQRIAHHRARRSADWRLVEEPLDLAAALRRHAAPEVCVLVDCLTLWLSNLLLADGEAAAAQATQATHSACSTRPAESGETAADARLVGAIDALIETLPQLAGRIILVSNEVGWGIVPMAALSRRFADEQGRLNQRVATVCERVTLVAAGLPLLLK